MAEEVLVPEDVCGADDRANQLVESLTEGLDFTIPPIDFSDPIYTLPGIDSGIYDDIVPLTNDALTTGEIDGPGTFDALMRGFKAHLKEEFDKNRITGAEYTKAYVALTQGAMQNAVQFLLQRDQAYWQAQQAQIAAISASIAHETAKLQYETIRFAALNSEATYARTKMEVSTLSIDFCIKKYTLDVMMPEQLLQLQEQTIHIQEQVESQRAQTLDTRRDGTIVIGSVGKQKELYGQQITAYIRDSEVKASKLFTDAWITQKTIDEALEPPEGFTNDSIDEILTVLKTNNNLEP